MKGMREIPGSGPHRGVDSRMEVPSPLRLRDKAVRLRDRRVARGGMSPRTAGWWMETTRCTLAPVGGFVPEASTFNRGLGTMSGRSITLTSVIFVGLALSLLGAVVAVLGLGGVVDFELGAGQNALQTDSLGLALLGTGALLVLAGTAKAEKAQVLGDGGSTPMGERVGVFLRERRWIPVLVLVAAVAAFVLTLR